MKVAHFGAGAIGRGFVTERLIASGHDVTLIDVNAEMMYAIDSARSFDIYWIDGQIRRDQCGPVHALAVSDVEAVADLLLGVDLVTTAVWATNLHTVAPFIADALEARSQVGAPPLQLIPCENAVDNGKIFADAVLDQLDGRDRYWLDNNARFASTVVDRMVFNAPHRDGTAPVEAGINFELVLDRSGLLDPETTLIKGADIADSLTPLLERKLFVINGGHARGAYLGALKGYTDMRQVYADSELLAAMRASMLQVAALISHDHGFLLEDVEGYVDFALSRWLSTGMPDEISRVGRSPIRKLAPEDRLVAPVLGALAQGFPHELLLDGIAAALLYRNPDDDEAVQLGTFVNAHGLARSLQHFTGIDPKSETGRKILAAAGHLRTTTQHEHKERL